MRHNRRGRQLSRDTEHRIALRRNMAQSLFEHGSIQTTLPKAKEVRGFAEKLITLAKRGDLNSRRRVIAMMQDRQLVDEDQEFTGQSVVQKLFSDVAPKFNGRNGGYTRIVRLDKYRIGDGGDVVMLSLVDEDMGGTEKPTGTVRKPAGQRRKRAERKFQFAKKVGGNNAPTTAAPESGDETPAAPAAGTPDAGDSVTQAPESGDKA
jgi:large subunit ribosomal protein L17